MVESENEEIKELEKTYSHLKVKRAMKKAIKKSSGKTISKAKLIEAAIASLEESMKDDLKKLVESNLSHFSVDGDSVSLKKKK